VKKAAGTINAEIREAVTTFRVDHEVGIIGAGFGGIIAALHLKRAGRNSFVVFERATEPGGVWRENVYPGCACDIRSHLYSIETQPNPGWSSTFASQPEILQYLKDVLERNGLQGRVRYGVEITAARFLEALACWQLTDQRGGLCYVRTLIVATGSHNRPSTPSIPGQAKFKGEMLHSSAWNSSVTIDKKRVAVIGTGASAIQIVPNIAATVAHLDVFQRTPPWVLPRGDREITAFERLLFKHVPLSQKLQRELIYWLLELFGLAFHGNEFLNRALARTALRKLATEVRDPAVRQQLTPRYKLGCKRIVVSDDFYLAFNRSNVRLVTEPIRGITTGGILAMDGQHYDVDVIVFATGFIVTEMDGYMDIVGRGGRILKDDWDANGMEAYLGIHVSGYPNLALLMGPNSGLGHSSVIHVMESQMQYILSWLVELDGAGPGSYFDVRPDRQRGYNADIQRRLTKTVWASGCKSWYLDRNGHNSTVFPGLTNDYRKATARFQVDDYDLVRNAI
jgi:cation diffusion facilitator CzcD-associated flavoprotein CzcO